MNLHYHQKLLKKNKKTTANMSWFVQAWHDVVSFGHQIRILLFFNRGRKK